jgi:hypothetical protein
LAPSAFERPSQDVFHLVHGDHPLELAGDVALGIDDEDPGVRLAASLLSGLDRDAVGGFAEFLQHSVPRVGKGGRRVDRVRGPTDNGCGLTGFGGGGSV